MLTEENAREKWCPFARVAFDWHGKELDAMRPMGPPRAEAMLSATVNRGDGVSAKPLCIASDCMAWRSGGKNLGREGTWIDVGYCGLAGRPDTG